MLKPPFLTVNPSGYHIGALKSLDPSDFWSEAKS